MLPNKSRQSDVQTGASRRSGRSCLKRYVSLKPSLLGSDTAAWSTVMRHLFILALIPTLTYAAPGPVTQHLMNEPASLFDVAMLRLRQSIGYWEKQMVLNYKRESRSDISGGNVNAYYQAEDDKIYIVLSIEDESPTTEQMEAGCRYALAHIGIYLRKMLPGLFQHSGPVKSAEPIDLIDVAVDMFELQCYVDIHQSGQRFWATRSLRAKDITIGPPK